MGIGGCDALDEMEWMGWDGDRVGLVGRAMQIWARTQGFSQGDCRRDQGSGRGRRALVGEPWGGWVGRKRFAAAGDACVVGKGQQYPP